MATRRLITRLAMVTLVALATTANAGCGLLLTHGPPESHEEMDYFTCTESNAGPIIDAVWGGLNLLSTLALAAESNGSDDYYSSEAAIVSGIGWVILSGTSATVGFNKTKKCRAAKQQLAERLAESARPHPTAELIVQSVVLTPDSDTLAVGARVQLTATAYNSAGGAIGNRIFSWSSSDDGIASVSRAGLVTAHAEGAAVITARTDDIVGTADIVVITGG